MWSAIILYLFLKRCFGEKRYQLSSQVLFGCYRHGQNNVCESVGEAFANDSLGNILS